MITSDIYFVLLLATAGFWVAGWLLNRPDGAHRHRARFLCALSLMAAVFVSNLRQDLWSLWWWFGFATFVGCWSWAAREFRRLEAARRVERLAPWKRK